MLSISLPRRPVVLIRTIRPILAIIVTVIVLSGCGYVRLLRPSVLKQFNPDVVALLNELPNVDKQDEDIIGRLFVNGGLSEAEVGKDGIMRDEIRVPEGQFIWKLAFGGGGGWRSISLMRSSFDTG